MKYKVGLLPDWTHPPRSQGRSGISFRGLEFLGWAWPYQSLRDWRQSKRLPFPTRTPIQIFVHPPCSNSKKRHTQDLHFIPIQKQAQENAWPEKCKDSNMYGTADVWLSAITVEKLLSPSLEQDNWRLQTVPYTSAVCSRICSKHHNNESGQGKSRWCVFNYLETKDDVSGLLLSNIWICA